MGDSDDEVAGEVSAVVVDLLSSAIRHKVTVFRM